jgi:NAD(P)-dependent dehydrogenase (short-subunit alcohol dehydrogenase family)
MASKKIILVTGANKGIGYEAVRQFAVAGHRVLLGARDPEKGISAVNKLHSSGLTNVSFLPLDVSNDQSVLQAVEAAKSAGVSHLDVLVNNAGIINESWGTAASQLSISKLRESFATNLEGVIRVTSAFLPLLKRNPTGHGRIINVSSTWGSLNALSTSISSQVPSYHISKAALNTYTILLAQELKSQNITVNSICPVS